jgi:hypothetical protein
VDETIRCSDCSLDFVFTAGEQAFYQDRGFTKPRRCKPCRDQRKAQKGGSPEAPAPRATPSTQWVNGDDSRNRVKPKRRRASDEF